MHLLLKLVYTWTSSSNEEDIIKKSQKKKEKKRVYNKKAYDKLKEEKKYKRITPQNEEGILKNVQEKSYDNIRNEKRIMKEDKCIHRKLIGSKEKKGLLQEILWESEGREKRERDCTTKCGRHNTKITEEKL